MIALRSQIQNVLGNWRWWIVQSSLFYKIPFGRSTIMQIQVSRVYNCQKKQINRGSIFIHFAYTSLGPLVDHMIIDFMTRCAIYYHKDVALVTATHFLVTPSTSSQDGQFIFTPESSFDVQVHVKLSSSDCPAYAIPLHTLGALNLLNNVQWTWHDLPLLRRLLSSLLILRHGDTTTPLVGRNNAQQHGEVWTTGDHLPM